jgi:hypothetical protein
MDARSAGSRTSAVQKCAFATVGVAAAALTWLVLRGDADYATTAAAPERAAGIDAQLVADARPDLASGVDINGAADQASDAALLAEPTSNLDRQAIAGPSSRRALRGQIVDARSGQGLPYVSVHCRSNDQLVSEPVVTDLDGRFVSPSTGSDAACCLWVTDIVNSKRLAQVEHEHSGSEAPADLSVPVEVGPTLIVRLLGAPADKGPWKLRLLERPLDQEWSWLAPLVFRSDGPLVARYVTFEHAPNLGHRTFVQVANENESWRGEIEVAGPAGVHVVDVEVAPFTATLFGRVVDADRQPLEAHLVALPSEAGSAAESLHEVSTDDVGWWLLSGLEPGATRLLVSSAHRAVQRLDVELAAGEERELEVVLPRVRIGGNVTGALAGPREGEEPIGIVHLQSADGGVTDLVQVCIALPESESNPPDDGRTPFVFPDVPAGRYRVSVIALDGRHYEPDSVEVESPGYAELTTNDVWRMPALGNYSLSVRDAETKALLDRTTSLFHLPPFWSTQPTPGDPVQELAFLGETAPVTLVVGRAGYIPAALFLPDGYRSARRIEGRVEVQLELERGFGAALVVLDGGNSIGGEAAFASQLSTMPAVAGAKVLCDGIAIGTSDAHGLALCRSAAPIRKVEVDLPGWTLLASHHFLSEGGSSYLPIDGSGGLGFVLMVRD